MSSDGVLVNTGSIGSNASINGPEKDLHKENNKDPHLQDQEKIDKLYALALKFFDKYPWRSIRALRPFVPVKGDVQPIKRSLIEKLIDAKIPEDLSRELGSLYDDIVIQKFEVMSLAGRKDLPAKIVKETDQIKKADNFLKIILWAYERSNPQVQTVSVNVPKGSKSNSFNIKIDPKSVALVQASKLFEGYGLDLWSSTRLQQENPNLIKGFITEIVKKICPATPKNKEVRAYEYYLDVYSTKDIPVPGLDSFESELTRKYGAKVNMPYKIWLADWVLSAERNSKIAQLDFDITGRYVDLRKHKRIFQYMEQHKAAYQKAAALLWSDHKDLKYSNILALFYANTFGELFWMDVEDPWQDNGAASWYGSKWSGSFDKEYKRYAKERKVTFGYGFDSQDNTVYSFPWIAATKFKMPVESQAFGPNQIAAGVLLKAGRADGGRLWKKYFPGKELNIENVVKAELDPDESVMALAMEHDYFLENIKKNPNLCVTFPKGQYPTMPDKEEARQYMLLNISAFFDAFPDVARNFPSYFPFAHQNWNLDYTCDFSAIMKKVMGIKEDKASMEMDFIPNKGFEKFDWLSPAKGCSFKDESSLMEFIKPCSKK